MNEHVEYIVTSYAVEHGDADRVRVALSPERAQQIVAIMKKLWPDSPICYRVDTYYDPPFNQTTK